MTTYHYCKDCLIISTLEPVVGDTIVIVERKDCQASYCYKGDWSL
jgi:hypothetical protein